jgi:hypothetical protein
MSVLLLGLALAVAEECVIQQTSLAPLVGARPDHIYGRAIGVNWVYFLWALVYESVWVVVIPIELAELIFADRRDQPWLGRRGVIVSSLVFVLASFVAWYSWTQQFVPRFFPESAYQPPLVALVIAIGVMVGLVAAALTLPGRASSLAEDVFRPEAPEPWQAGLAAFMLALPWFGLIFLAYGAAPSTPPVIPILTSFGWACGALWLFRRWSRLGWTDGCRLASILGALGASMLAGYLVLWTSAAPAIDFLGKVVFNGVALGLLIRLARQIRNRPRLLSVSSSTLLEQSL